MRPFLILGAGTGLGKTLLTAGLCHQYTQAGYRVEACKPLCTGFSPHDDQSDPAILLRSLNKSVTPHAIAEITPWRYAAPQSPHWAARAEGGAPPLEEIASYCRGMARRNADFLFTEAAGGVMTPLNEAHTFLDLAAALQWPALLVAGTYVGAISHTLTALAALAARNLRPHALVLSESGAGGATACVMAESIRAFAPGVRVYPLARQAAHVEQWRHLPPLAELCC